MQRMERECERDFGSQVWLSKDHVFDLLYLTLFILFLCYFMLFDLYPQFLKTNAIVLVGVHESSTSSRQDGLYSKISTSSLPLELQDP